MFLRLAALLFFGSGFAALLYQVLWQRILGIFSGVHIYSITMIVTAFMAGLGIGSLAGGRLADRLSRRHAVVAFALCELVIGVFGLVSPWLYYDFAYVRLGFLVRYPFMLPLVHLGLLLVPTFLMGASLPLLARGLVRRTDRAARTIGVLYGVNALGASVGALAAAWYMIGAFGFVTTIRLGAATNLLVALGAAWIAKKLASERSSEESVLADVPRLPMQPSTRTFRLGTWCLLYGLSGFIALSLELIWFRVLDVAIKASPYTFGHLLGIFLGFLALGSLTGALWWSRTKKAVEGFLWGQWAISLTSGAALVFLCYVPVDWPLMKDLHAYWGDPFEPFELFRLLHAFGGGGEAGVVSWAATLYLVLPLGLLGLPTFLMGLTFTWIQRAVQTDPNVVGWRVGTIQTANIAGSILGSLLTGALFLTWLGTPRTISVLLGIGAVFALLASLRIREPMRRAGAATVTVGISLALAFSLPSAESFWARFHGTSEENLLVGEDASGVASLHTIRGNYIMRVNGKMHGNLPYRSVHTILGLMPALVYPELEEALVIGLGSGNTPWAVAASPNLTHMDIYEIVSPEVAVLEQFFARGMTYPAVSRLLSDPRIDLKLSDGRLALRTEPRAYDLIEADALEPSMAYSGNLYSQEFFELCRSRLKPGGILLTYVPTERTRRTVLSVFPHALDFHAPGYASFIVAGNEPIEFDRERALGVLHNEKLRRYLSDSGEVGATQMLEDYLTQASVTVIGPVNREKYLDGDVNRDLYPRDEYDKSYDGTYQ